MANRSTARAASVESYCDGLGCLRVPQLCTTPAQRPVDRRATNPAMTRFNEALKSLKARYKRARRNSNTISGVSINASSEKRAAICYLTSPFTSGFARPLPNEVNIRNIVGIFLELGYVVDIYDHDHELEPLRTYDVIFGLGQTFESASAHPQHRGALKLLYLAEMPPHYSQRVENERFAHLLKKGVKLKVVNKRCQSFYSKRQMEMADAIIAIGSQAQREIISSCVTLDVSMVQPSILSGRLPVLKKANRRSSTDYCWIGSSGALIKGLDLLIDAFSMEPSKTLHLFGLSEADKVFLDSVKSPNIVDHGFHSVDSDHFAKVVSKCTFVISSSFSEGSSTGIITGMGMGCTPVVSSFCGTEFVEDSGVLIEEMNVEGVLAAMRVAEERYGALEEESRIRMANHVRSYYSEDAYRERLSQAIRFHLDHAKRSCL